MKVSDITLDDIKTYIRLDSNDEDTFLEYIKKELNSRQLQMSEHIEVSLEDFDNKHGYF